MHTSIPTRSPTYGLPAVGLLVAAIAWLPVGFAVPLVISAEGSVAARVAFAMALGAWCWIQTRVGRALAVLDRAPEPVLRQRIWFGIVVAILVALAGAIALRSIALVAGAIPLTLAFVASPLLLLFVARRGAVRGHLAAALRGEVAYYGRDRALAQVGVAMVFVHCLSFVVKVPVIVLVLVLGLVAIPATFADPAGGLVLVAVVAAGALWCGKSLLALRLGWAATQGRVDPAGFARRVRTYRIASWVAAGLLCIVAVVAESPSPVLDRLAFAAVFLPSIVAWPAILGGFVRRMQREANLAGPFVPDPNRGLVVGGWLLLGAAAFALLGLQLDWIPFFNAVAPKVHPGVGATLLYAAFSGWAAAEALAQTSRARLAVALFGLFSLVYLPVAAMLVAAGVGTPTASLTSLGGPRTTVDGSYLWLVPLLPSLLLSAIALGAKKT